MEDNEIGESAEFESKAKFYAPGMEESVSPAESMMMTIVKSATI